MKTEVIRIFGIVQGVGFRPFVSRTAKTCHIYGSVCNKGSYVEVIAQGEEAARQQFRRDLIAKAPDRSSILNVATAIEDRKPYMDFTIIESARENGTVFVSPDIAICEECKQELFDETNRRYLHPFINCTACGPRLTILDAMPYDRERTSMKEFPMCPECEFEYTHPETRRYDAQPVCCNDCGPEVYIVGTDIRGRDAITRARQAVIDGEIVAIKGIGGFHLCCDATSEEAVARLRRLKRRPAKPFAIMARSLEAVDRICSIPSDSVRELLDGHSKPIVLLERINEGVLAPSVAPDNPKVGVMLPYAPVQMLMFDYNDDLDIGTDYFVMTSGNVSGAPICRTDEDAVAELSDFCDVILSHNRTIRLRADDSVVDVYKDEPYMIRRSRGFAPLPVMTEEEIEASVLAVGGELKNTFCIGKDQLLYESPFVGDMADVRTVRALNESIDRMAELLETDPEVVVCDLHPKYNTTEVAERYADKHNIPLIRLQHHYAHILSCMAENDYTDEVIGLSMDGTGYGTDGTIWGGEVLLARRDGFERLSHIDPFMQAGGDLSAKEGWRIAASMINSLFGDEAEEICEKLGICSSSDLKLIKTMTERGINSVKSTSAGRLFDAVSAILGVRRASSFEGEAATTLQFRAIEAKGESKYPGQNRGDGSIASGEIVKWLVGEMLQATDKDQTQRELAWAFHEAFAREMADSALYWSEKTGIKTIALSGGVMQNTLLLGMFEKYLEERELKVIRHHMIPPNDGGIALGQALYARWEVGKCV